MTASEVPLQKQQFWGELARNFLEKAQLLVATLSHMLFFGVEILTTHGSRLRRNGPYVSTVKWSSRDVPA